LPAGDTYSLPVCFMTRTRCLFALWYVHGRIWDYAPLFWDGHVPIIGAWGVMAVFHTFRCLMLVMTLPTSCSMLLLLAYPARGASFGVPMYIWFRFLGCDGCLPRLSSPPGGYAVLNFL